MSFDKELFGCFGEKDKIFALHPFDEERAFSWLKSLRERHIGWTKAKD